MPPPSPGPIPRAVSFLRRHPIVALVLLTPGIPEYLSGSSNLSGILWNPVVFGAFLLLNVGMYAPGALLIREAMVRWRGGWGTVAVLGTAYAVMEEGIADATFFNPHNPNVGVLGSYGHFLGTNWVWIPGVVMVHVVFSLAIPLFLFGLAFPDLRGRSLLVPWQIGLAAGILTVDTAAIAAIGAGVLHWFDGWAVIAVCLVVIVALAGIARRLPAGWPKAPTELPRLSPRRFFVLGLALFPAVAATPAILGAFGAPAPVAWGALVLLLGAFAGVLYRSVGRDHHRRHLLAFSAGAILPPAVLGVLGGLPVPVVLGADLLAYLFFRRLWRSVEADGPGPSTGTLSVRPNNLSGAG